MMRGNEFSPLPGRGKALPGFLLTWVLIAALCLAPCAAQAADAAPRRPIAKVIDDTPIAWMDCGGLTGRQHSPIRETEAQIVLIDGNFGVLCEGDDITDWFIDLPAGLSVTVRDTEMDPHIKVENVANIVISGTPTKPSTKEVRMIIPEYVVIKNSENGWENWWDAVECVDTIPCNIVPANQPGPDSRPNSGNFLLDKLLLGTDARMPVYNLLPPGFTEKVTWLIDDQSVCRIVGQGRNAAIRPLKRGSALLTALFQDGAIATIPVTIVKSNRAAGKLTLKGSLLIRSGRRKKAACTVGPATARDKTLKWYTTDKTVAGVDWYGNISGRGPGTCKIYAITTAGVRKAISVTVKR